jgi:hypothetical protein
VVFVALAPAVRWGVRWPRSEKHVLFFYEHAVLVARVAGWGKLAVEADVDDRAEWPAVAALSWLPDRIAGLHPENRLIPMASVREARFRHNWRLFRDELVLTLNDGSQLKFSWVWRINVPSGEDLVQIPYPQDQKPVMRYLFGERLSSD